LRATREVISSSCVGQRRKPCSLRSVSRNSLSLLVDTCVTCRVIDLTSDTPLVKRPLFSHSDCADSDDRASFDAPDEGQYDQPTSSNYRNPAHLGSAYACLSTSLSCLALADPKEAFEIHRHATIRTINGCTTTGTWTLRSYLTDEPRSYEFRVSIVRYGYHQ
jgi:hypothetical protein